MALSEAQQRRLAEAKANPYVRAALDMIAASEGTVNTGQNSGYDVVFGGGTAQSLATHPNQASTFRDKRGTPTRSTAAGRYQIIKPTFDGLAKRLGRSDFSPETQDDMAILLMMERGALNPIMQGDIKAGINRLGSVWASLPSSKYKDTQSARTENFALTAYSNALAQYANGVDVKYPTISAQPDQIRQASQYSAVPQPPQFTGPTINTPLSQSTQAGGVRAGLAVSPNRLSPETVAQMQDILFNPNVDPNAMVYPSGNLTEAGLIPPSIGGTPAVPQLLPSVSMDEALERLNVQPLPNVTDLASAPQIMAVQTTEVAPTIQDVASYFEEQLERIQDMEARTSVFGAPRTESPYANQLRLIIGNTPMAD